ncbi:MAG: flagellar biosynthesis protein FlhA [Acidimicrobiia bacterium]
MASPKSQVANRIGQLAIPAGIVAIVALMIIPLPTVIIDYLLVINITAGVLTLLVSMFVQRPLDFSIFPSYLLIATLLRLALNIAVTRSVLLHAYAGSVVNAFGHIVVGGSVIVGFVIFLILITIQFVVITNGAGRVAEVAARFTLDAMPGKQMAIDADLAAGVITDDEARIRRREVADEADFYGAMDGSSKFVKGDAIASIVIVVVNMVGGIVIGITQKGMGITDALQTYTLLTIGDGLVSQIPALLLSMSAGLIVTRATTESDLGSDILTQFTRFKRVLQIGGGGIVGLAIIPGLPKVPFLIVGIAILVLATRLPSDQEKADAEALEAALDVDTAPAPDSPEALAQEMRVDPLELEISYDLVDLVDPGRGGDLLDRVKALRRKLALELGMVIPLVRTRDNLDLPPHTYAIRVHGVELGRGEAPAGCVLAIGDHIGDLPGAHTREPVFGLPAVWVPLEFKQQAEIAGATVVDRSSVITTHLAEIVRRNAGRLLSRADVKSLLDMVKMTDPVVAEEITAAQLNLGDIQRVLQELLDENVPIRDLVRICEVLSERGRITKDIETLTEAVRTVLGPAISASYAIDGTLQVLTLDPMVEQALIESRRVGEQGSFLAVDPNIAEVIAREVARIVDDAERAGQSPVLVCSTQIRAALYRLVRAAAPRLPVLAFNELGPQLQLETIGTVNLGQPATI